MPQKKRRGPVEECGRGGGRRVRQVELLKDHVIADLHEGEERATSMKKVAKRCELFAEAVEKGGLKHDEVEEVTGEGVVEQHSP